MCRDFLILYQCTTKSFLSCTSAPTSLENKFHCYQTTRYIIFGCFLLECLLVSLRTCTIKCDRSVCPISSLSSYWISVKAFVNATIFPASSALLPLAKTCLSSNTTYYQYSNLLFLGHINNQPSSEYYESNKSASIVIGVRPFMLSHYQ